MDGKLKRVVELANQLQEAALECGCVISVSIDGDRRNRINTGIHVWKPQSEGVEGLEFYEQDNDGTRWFNSWIYGINIFGAVRGDEEN